MHVTPLIAEAALSLRLLGGGHGCSQVPLLTIKSKKKTTRATLLGLILELGTAC